MRIVLRLLIVAVVLCLVYPVVILALYFGTPAQNAKLGKVDTMIVLGCPSKPDGSPTPEQRERVLESVREFKKGTSDHIIMTGGAAHNNFVEAHSMALFAEANGVPASAVIEEGQAHDTIQNLYYSDQIMTSHGWHSAEVISSPYHLPRTALILHHYPQMQWKEEAAEWPPEYGWKARWDRYWREAIGVFNLRVHGFKSNKYLPNQGRP
jgi:uncharacterized SAM-binding protein YcdF (DUF218 family)